jgi:hypothetical protein
MDKYIGTKIIEAEPAFRCFEGIFIKSGPMPGPMGLAEDGYKVRYEDGYESWSPKDVFEQAYLRIIPNPTLKSAVSISQQMVDSFIKGINVDTLGTKTTVVQAVLVNGFEITETCACVDPDNYSEEIGKDICLGKIKDMIWAYLGFLLQTGVNGIKPAEEDDLPF